MSLNSKYQLILLGHNNPYKSNVIDTFLERVSDLGLTKSSILILDENNLGDYRSNSPTVCIYFGGMGINKHMPLLQPLLKEAVFVLPVVDDLSKFGSLIPEELRTINGFELKGSGQIDALVGSVLEGLSLLRLSRRLFISYRRIESRSIAIQLYEHLDSIGFDVFLDTHSIRPGEPFQEELWHRLVDTDVVVVLNTPDFLGSEWTREEVAKASAMSIGILQLVWPQYIPNDDTGLCFPIYLSENQFNNKDFSSANASLLQKSLLDIGVKVESLRARSLAARQDNIIKEFFSTARAHGYNPQLQPEKFITMERRDGKEIAIIPTVGVPHAFTYNQSEELIKRIREHKSPEAILLYDHRNIRKRWQTHLSWLDQYLPVKTQKVTDVEHWIKSL